MIIEVLKWGRVDKILAKIERKVDEIATRFNAYKKRLLYPIYLFPVKLVTYSAYYLVKFSFKTVISLIKIIFEMIIYPFKGLKNFLKSVFVVSLVLYVLASLFVIADYIRTQYGYYGKFFCALGSNERLKKSVVRIVGGYSEGSGFFVEEDKVLTNFHVIADEPSPKVIFPDGAFVTPIKITGDKEADLALLYLKEKYPEKVLPFLEPYGLIENEPLISAGYALGTDLVGEATVVKGSFIAFRQSKHYPVSYVQTNISLAEGMSGGPLVDSCGKLVGVNTAGLAGLSLFVSADDLKRKIPEFTDQEIVKIEVDPSESPQEAVRAFYTYLKARKMEDGFNLLSEAYLQKTNYEEWTNRFTDILDVQIYLSEPYENTKDTAFVKFSTKNWVDNEVEIHYYEGTWQTVLEDRVYKMYRSNIKEIENPAWEWFYG